MRIKKVSTDKKKKRCMKRNRRKEDVIVEKRGRERCWEKSKLSFGEPVNDEKQSSRKLQK